MPLVQCNVVRRWLLNSIRHSGKVTWRLRSFSLKSPAGKVLVPQPSPCGTFQVARVLAYLLVCKTIVSVLFTFRDYFPPNFRSDFLLGRNEYFFGAYQWAFYTHIISGPFALFSGL